MKTFWSKVPDKLQKPEIASVGVTFSESEARHSDAYSHLLEKLGLNSEFDNINKIKCLKDRADYLNSKMTFTGRKNFVRTLLIFSVLIEHISLFSQFLIIMSFNKHKNMLKGVSNVVEATSKEEQIHGNFGIHIVNIIRKEQPELFDEDLENEIKTIFKESMMHESKIIEWIFEKGELDFLPKADINEFIKNRINKGLQAISFDKVFDVDYNSLVKTEWFDDEILASKHVDFFVKHSVNYNKKSKSITSDDLF